MTQFKEMNMEEILKYVKETEKKLEDMQQELKTLEGKKEEYMLDSNKLENLYAGQTDESKKYLEYVNMLRMHLIKSGFLFYEKFKHLYLQNPDFLEAVFDKYSIFVNVSGFKAELITQPKVCQYNDEEEAKKGFAFGHYVDAINKLHNALKIPKNILNQIENKNWKYENGKIEPALDENSQKFFYNVIGGLGIWKNYLNDKFEKDNPGSLEKMVDLKKQIELESDVSNKRSFRFRLRCVFLDLLAKTDFIDSVLKYANNEMEDEDRKALESLCSFKYFNKDNVQNGSVGAFCDELGKNSSFKELANENKEKVLDTLGDFWDGCLKNKDKKKDKIVQVKKEFGIKIKAIKPNEVKIIKPEEKLVNNNLPELNLDQNLPIQNENEFNNNLINQNNISPKLNINGNENPTDIDEKNQENVIYEKPQNNGINPVTNALPKSNEKQNPNEIVVDIGDNKNDVNMKLKSNTKSNTVSKVCFWTFSALDVLLIIGCVFCPPVGFGLIGTVPITVVAGYYFLGQSNDNEKFGLKVGNGSLNAPGFVDPNGKQKSKEKVPVKMVQSKGVKDEQK